ncbi:hypothetical protein DOI34_25075 [Salmonella enterica subsp. enterica serovar Virchow]|nr:hypothetical protein [Salmonella enterica subsp. enterica]EBV3599841.1 hypothetical protein [Salmonella enterica subsp. enterica serovar Virchow]EBW2249968.1 hypothetical protein [Salmonella enterica subsp. enterica serovar Enteritidis]EBX4816654.1 hypothetical protein [Salmonella enterica subsp. enterica serovar Newport]ECI7685669.1 hypothetical protein [Salmonella enterica subsp. enterica serovar Paratyphi A]EFG6100470.1 hypothetical protein [Escherichia coli]
MMVNPQIPGLTQHEIGSAGLRPTALPSGSIGLDLAYATAREAEVFAMTEALKLQDAIPEARATSLAGVIAKLEMILGADRDIGDPTDFPWPHIASVLSDLKQIAGELPPSAPDRAVTRAEVAKHWAAATELVTALNEEERRALSA